MCVYLYYCTSLINNILYSAALQEHVGRQGAQNFMHGIDIITIAGLYIYIHIEYYSYIILYNLNI